MSNCYISFNSLALFSQPILKKEKFEYNATFFSLNINLVLHLVAEVIGKYIGEIS